MRLQIEMADRLQETIDWAVFGMGTLALVTALVATLLSVMQDQVAEAPVTVIEKSVG